MVEANGDEIRAFVERIEALDEEKRALAESRKELLAELKGRGYDSKVILKIVSLRKRDRDDVAEEEAILALYLSALGGE